VRVLHFQGSAKFSVYLGFTCHECHIIEVFIALKQLRTYLHTTRAYEREIQEVYPSCSLHVVARNQEHENTHSNFSAIKPKITSVSQLLV